jgi:dTDP-4-dehydrorhamnose reductase
MAVTEVHLNSTCEGQLNWLRRIWRAAELLRQNGADVRAVTAWALFGAYDWNCLVTRPHGYYESGAFDVSSGTPQPTHLTDLLRELAASQPSRSF